MIQLFIDVAEEILQPEDVRKPSRNETELAGHPTKLTTRLYFYSAAVCLRLQTSNLKSPS